MFAALFNRAQATVDNAIGQAINRAIVAVPFVIAGAFATAALTIRLTRILGDEYGYLAIAGIFVIVGLVAALVMQPSTATATASDPHPQRPTKPPKRASTENIRQRRTRSRSRLDGCGSVNGRPDRVAGHCAHDLQRTCRSSPSWRQHFTFSPGNPASRSRMPAWSPVRLRDKIRPQCVFAFPRTKLIRQANDRRTRQVERAARRVPSRRPTGRTKCSSVDQRRAGSHRTEVAGNIQQQTQ